MRLIGLLLLFVFNMDINLFGQKNNISYINAQIKGEVIGKNVGFIKMNISTTDKIDTIFFKKSQFSFNKKFIKNELCTIIVEGDYYQHQFYIDSSCISISINLNTHEFLVFGGFENSAKALLKKINKPYDSVRYSIENKIKKYKNEGNLDSLILYQQRWTQNETDRIYYDIENTKYMDNGLYQLGICNFILSSQSLKSFFNYWKKIPSYIKTSKTGESLLKRYKSLKAREKLINKEFVKIAYLNRDSLEITNKTDSLVLLDFWATWCKPCIEEFPIVNQLRKTSLIIKTISIDDSYTKWNDFLFSKELIGFQYWISKKDQQLIEKYSLGYIPLKVLIRSQKVIAINPSYEDIIYNIIKK